MKRRILDPLISITKLSEFRKKIQMIDWKCRETPRDLFFFPNVAWGLVLVKGHEKLTMLARLECQGMKLKNHMLLTELVSAVGPSKEKPFGRVRLPKQTEWKRNCWTWNTSIRKKKGREREKLSSLGCMRAGVLHRSFFFVCVWGGNGWSEWKKGRNRGPRSP